MIPIGIRGLHESFRWPDAGAQTASAPPLTMLSRKGSIFADRPGQGMTLTISLGGEQTLSAGSGCRSKWKLWEAFCPTRA